MPEPPTAKNRVHLDVFTESIEALAERGAAVQQPLEGGTIMTDPEGNEFCVFRPSPSPLVRTELPREATQF